MQWQYWQQPHGGLYCMLRLLHGQIAGPSEIFDAISLEADVDYNIEGASDALGKRPSDMQVGIRDQGMKI